MVRFTADEEHFIQSRSFMKELRQDGTFCDISLLVGSQVLKAHRNVLAAGSSYFRALFLGQFAEASMNEINLSEVTKDMSALEMMVDCLYTGEIDINDDNLDTVVKLSSYFIMETVLGFCKKYMIDTLSLQNCLKYHMRAMKHGLTDIVDRITPVVKTRFHDFIIFEEKILNVSAKELMSLHQNDVFQSCKPHDVLKFVVDWVKIGLTAEHISVGTQILDSVCCIKGKASFPLMHATEETLRAACEEMVSTVSKARLSGDEEFIDDVIKLRNQCIGNGDSKSGYNEKVLPTADMPSASVDVDKENVLITLSPRKCIIDNFVASREPSITSPGSTRNHTRPYTESVFDICAYVPSMRCWYYLKPIDDELFHTLDLGKLLFEGSFLEWGFTMRSDQPVFVNKNNVMESEHHIDVKMALLSLNSNTFEEFSFENWVKQHLLAYQCRECNQFCVVTGTDNTVYLITVSSCRHGVWGQNLEIFFSGFKFQDSDQGLEFFFQTEKYQLEDPEFDTYKHEMHASISTVSNEMLIMYLDKGGEHRSIVFMVNLDLETPVPVPLRNSMELDDAFEDIHMSIVQGEQKFFILYDILQRADNQRIIKVKYEYEYHSNRLTTVEADGTELGENEIIEPTEGYCEDQTCNMPCLIERKISERNSTWYICGDIGLVSKLTEVTIGPNRTPVITSHPPPPFTCITAAFAGTVSKNVLKKFRPVSFLGEKQLKNCRVQYTSTAEWFNASIEDEEDDEESLHTSDEEA